MNTNDHAETEVYVVDRILQTEKQDIYRITNKESGEVVYEKFPRTMENNAINVLSYYE